MAETTKDFGPIQDAYAFFVAHSDEDDRDLDAYAARLPAVAAAPAPLRFLDFGCGPGTFTERFLDRAGWTPDRLRIGLVEPVETYRTAAAERLRPRSTAPIEAVAALSPATAGVFDLVLANHVLYYVQGLHDVLAGILRAMAPGGSFLTAMAGRDNALIRIWIEAFGQIGRPVPYHTSEDLETTLHGLGLAYQRHEVRYRLDFDDTEPNRLQMLRFLLGEHLARMPLPGLLRLFDPHRAGDRIEIRTGHHQYGIRPG